MAQISRLVWRSADVPEELHELLATLEEEYPVSSYGRGLKLKAKRVEPPLWRLFFLRVLPCSSQPLFMSTALTFTMAF